MKRNFAFFAWREFTRSASFGKNMAAKGVLIFLALYFTLVAVFMGFNLSMFLSEMYPDQSQISAFNSLVLIYLGIDLILRILIQSLPTFGFQPFLILPVKKSRIAWYMLNKSVFHFFNILPFFLLLPFTFKSAVNELQGIQLATWLLTLFFMVFINHFLGMYLKWRTNEDDRFFYGFLVLVAAIFAIDYFKLVDLTGGFGLLIDSVIQNSLAVFIFPLLLVGFYFLNQKYILNRFYLDELSKKKKQSSAHDFTWLNKVGEYGKMLSLEVKMILRNKRPRTALVMSLLFLLYGFLIYRDYDDNFPEAMIVFGGMFMTGIFGMNYGQFFPAWHSRYFSFLMAQNVKMKQILQSAFFLMAATNLVFYLISLGYMFITPKVLYIHLAVMLYNVGVNSFVIFALGLNSRKSIDLDTRAMFNYQGMGATQWLMAFPILFGPMAVYGIMVLAFGKIAAYFILGGLGLVGIILHPRLIDYFTKQYIKRKHSMLTAYKNS
jgi:hypothetical protein